MAPSNIAVDTVVSRFIEKDEDNRRKIRRLGPKMTATLRPVLGDVFLPELCVDDKGVMNYVRLGEELAQTTILAGTIAACRWNTNLPLSHAMNVVFDESGQAYEAEMGSALNIAKERIVLVGDHHQLGARIRQAHL